MFYLLYCRSAQKAARSMTKRLQWRVPITFGGKGSLKQLEEIMNGGTMGKALVITDDTMVELKLVELMQDILQEGQHPYTVFSKTVPNPTVENIEDALHLYHQENCSSLIAFGGGSVIDCGKAVGARVARPNKSLAKMSGMFKVRKPLPPLIAIPTTSGTGSEATLAAVISNPSKKEKNVMMDLALIPTYAILDPSLTCSVPPKITAETGMDALTHAVEAYIGLSTTEETRRWSLEATTLVFTNIRQAYQDGTDVDARLQMQRASYLAGLAFTRAYVGNVHAIAHTLGGMYGTPHGFANAVILPQMLRKYGKKVYPALSELALAAGVGKPRNKVKKNARLFIKEIEQLNEDMNIPTKIASIRQADIRLMAKRAHSEANPLYPVPLILSKRAFRKFYRKLLVED
ncbi:alcohol dehydrogenase class IV [Alkalihalobacillus xiaoxiensis]|uniref:Alcohol dehydrogenase class IV n=1 Tax=Shouchella xiaoxiensis TaxID=766895 RepID=A0ABS2T0G9_9BACI|nr:iron-containing alcohol dehydrogenase [Shouchella xiaoxiensis]MBM7841278.1 alcohol dehydrogenase class IV [Shouchella xiaoxiensis]